MLFLTQTELEGGRQEMKVEWCKVKVKETSRRDRRRPSTTISMRDFMAAMRRCSPTSPCVTGTRGESPCVIGTRGEDKG